MKSPRRVFAIGAILYAALAFAQQPPYPAKPIKMIMPFPAGGPTDILGRLLGQKLTEAWGQNVVIDNRPGGGGMIGSNLAAKSPPDGYTLFLGGITTLALAPYLQKNLQYDPLKDFQPVSQTTISPLLLMVHPSLPVKSVKEFVALAKARPGQINYASSGPGGSGHLAGELFKYVTRTDLVHVPYRGAPPALMDLAAGQVQTMFGTMLASVPLIRNGKLRAIAVTGPKRSIAVPDVPTFAESGLPSYDASSWNGILVPAGTPRPIVERLSAEIVKIMHTPGVLDRLAADGPVPVGNSPEAFAAMIKAEQAKWSKVIREANIRIE
ncbi:MAG: Bug family tripartite tricarboxylate transporter substrate binding protein [Burkholderiales bacterium]